MNRLSQPELLLTISTPPAAEPISTADMKTHLRVDTSDDDTYIDALVAAARAHVENYTRRALINQTWKLYLDYFPSVITTPKPPLSSVTSIQYVDGDGTTQTATGTLYTADTDALPGRIYEAYNQNWPSDVRSVEKAVTVTYVAGYGATGASVPDPILHAIKMLVGHWYENRENVVVGTISSQIPDGVNALLSPYRVYWW